MKKSSVQSSATMTTPDADHDLGKLSAGCEAPRSAGLCLNLASYSQSQQSSAKRRIGAICQRLVDKAATDDEGSIGGVFNRGPPQAEGIGLLPNSHHETSSIDDTGGGDGGERTRQLHGICIMLLVS